MSSRPNYKDEPDQFDLGRMVEIARNLYAVDPTVADLYHQAMEKNLPCGYSWTTVKQSNEGWALQDIDSDGEIGTKEGQALTGDVKKRVQAFATTHPQVILDVLIDPYFSVPQRDKELNEWRNEHEHTVELDTKRRTLEGMRYHDLDALRDLRFNRRKALQALTGDRMAGSIEVFLGTLQYRKAVYALKVFREGGRSLLADLCARFGKTIWAGVLADMSGRDLVIIATYVKTVHASFRTDLGNKRQFLDVFDFVNCEDTDWKQQLDRSLVAGRRVMIFLSLCPGSNRQDRINYLGSLAQSRMWIVDEADYGAHQKKQVDALKQGVGPDDLLVLMTGTNPDVAVRRWADVRQFKEVSCTYSEALEQKKQTQMELMR